MYFPKIVVTGGQGLIGSKLCELVPSYSIDIKNCLDFRQATITNNIEVVYHLGGLTRVQQVEDDYEYGLSCANALPRFIEKCGPDRLFVYASSKEVYGDIQNAEPDSPYNPKSRYAELKVAQEQMCDFYHHRGWNVKIVRFSTVFGDVWTDYPDRVIPQFIRNALSNSPIIINGGDKMLEPTRLKTVVDWLASINLHSPYKTLIASGQPISLRELAYLIKRLAHSTSDIVETTASAKHGNFSSKQVNTQFNLEQDLALEITMAKNRNDD